MILGSVFRRGDSDSTTKSPASPVASDSSAMEKMCSCDFGLEERRSMQICMVLQRFSIEKPGAVRCRIAKISCFCFHLGERERERVEDGLSVCGLAGDSLIGMDGS